MFGWFTDAKLQKVFHDGKGVIFVLESLHVLGKL